MIFGNSTTYSNRPSRRGHLALLVAALGALAAAFVVIATAGSSNAAGRTPAKAHSAFAQQCPDRYPAQRDPSNPLMLPAAPGPNPLHGANFFVDGPRHGAAASAIATLGRAQSQQLQGRLLLGPLPGQPDPRIGRQQAGAQPRACPQGRPALEDRQPARVPADQHLLRGRQPRGHLRSDPEDPLPQPDRRPRIDPGVHDLLPAPSGRRLRHQEPADGRRAGRSAAGSTRWPRPPATVPPCSCSRSTASDRRDACRRPAR